MRDIVVPKVRDLRLDRRSAAHKNGRRYDAGIAQERNKERRSKKGSLWGTASRRQSGILDPECGRKGEAYQWARSIKMAVGEEKSAEHAGGQMGRENETEFSCLA